MGQIAARISEEEKQELEKYCREHDIKLSQLIRWAIKEYIEKNKVD